MTTAAVASCPVLVPASYEEAVHHLVAAGPGGRILAGGQSLAVLMHLGMAEPDALISLRRCPGARAATERDGVVRIGARVTVAEAGGLGGLDVVREAARQVASPHVRIIGTVVGNVCHADPGNDLAGPLLCHDTTATVLSARGRREVALADLFAGPYELALDEGEFVMELAVPQLPGWRGAYRKVVWRSADHPVAGVAAALRVADGRVAQARISLAGAVGVPVRLPDVESALCGRPVDAAAAAGTEAAVTEIAELSVLGADEEETPARYRRQVACVLVGDAVDAALTGSRSGGGTNR